MVLIQFTLVFTNVLVATCSRQEYTFRARSMSQKHATKDVLQELKKYGRFQASQGLLGFVALAFIAMSSMSYIFVAKPVKYRCRIAECEDANSTAAMPSWWPKDTETECSRPILNMSNYYTFANGTCSNSSFLEEWQQCRDWIYENNDTITSEVRIFEGLYLFFNVMFHLHTFFIFNLFGAALEKEFSILSTLGTQFNLGCQMWKATLVGSVHNAARICSSITAGWISDRYGRKFAFIIFSIAASCGLLKLIVTNYYLFLIVEFLESFCSSGILPAIFVLLIEVGGESMRVASGILNSFALDFGDLLLAIVAMNLPYWKHLILAINGPMLMFITYAFLLRESPRWQILQGKTKEVKETFQIMRRFNKLDVTSKEIDDLSDEDLKHMFSDEVQVEKESFKDIIKSKEIMKRLLVTSICYFTSGFVFSGLSVYSVLLPGTDYMNYALKALSAFGGELMVLYALSKFGRRISLQCGYIVSAVFILGQAYVPEDLAWLKITLFLIGNFSCIVCYTAIYTYGAELMPTSARGLLLGYGYLLAMVGNMLGPTTPLLAAEWKELPPVLFFLFSVLSGALLVFMPETKYLPMFDTIAQIDSHAKKYVSRL